MPDQIRFVIITGFSGAGKSETVKIFEDLGYFCVDNLPPSLIPKFSELCGHSSGMINRIALVVDLRSGNLFEDVYEALASLDQAGFGYEILFLEASEDVLVRRFKESRRRHPLAARGGISEGIHAEEVRLGPLRGRATMIIDTSEMSSKELRETIRKYYTDMSRQEQMPVTIISFGFKNGLPLDADLVFDVRFLPNPHYVETLQPLDGNHAAVSDYVFKWPLAMRFLNKLYDFVDFLLPQYIKEGKTNLIIGIGCTGGKHRSVAIANRLGDFLKTKGYQVQVDHRDIR
jgi:UPF0042 nucleotide-binding protein